MIPFVAVLVALSTSILIRRHTRWTTLFLTSEKITTSSKLKKMLKVPRNSWDIHLLQLLMKKKMNGLSQPKPLSSSLQGLRLMFKWATNTNITKSTTNLVNLIQTVHLLDGAVNLCGLRKELRKMSMLFLEPIPKKVLTKLQQRKRKNKTMKKSLMLDLTLILTLKNQALKIWNFRRKRMNLQMNQRRVSTKRNSRKKRRKRERLRKRRLRLTLSLIERNHLLSVMSNGRRLIHKLNHWLILNTNISILKMKILKRRRQKKMEMLILWQ